MKYYRVAYEVVSPHFSQPKRDLIRAYDEVSVLTFEEETDANQHAAWLSRYSPYRDYIVECVVESVAELKRFPRSPASWLVENLAAL